MRLTKHRHGLVIFWGDLIAHEDEQWRCAVWACGYENRYGNVATWKVRTPAEQIMWLRSGETEEPTLWLKGTMDTLAGAGRWSWQQRQLESWLYFRKRRTALEFIRTVEQAVDGMGGYARH